MEIKKQLVIHHDDLGGSHGANVAFVELSDLGVATCGSVMVPAPWFMEVATIASQRPDLDIGVHLTLTSEFSRYRWRPLTSGASLLDSSGHFWPGIEGARSASAAEVRDELRAQVEMALEVGIDVTHLDSHMGTAWQPEFVEVYVDLGQEFQLPIVLTRDVQSLSAPHENLDDVFIQIDQNNNPVFRRFLTTPFGNAEPTLDDYVQLMAGAEEGLNWGGFHFAAPGDIEYITDDASTRIAEYEIFRSNGLSGGLLPGGFELTGMRAFRNAMRSRL